MKDKLIDLIRSVPIAGKTYPEYVEALADKLIENGCKVYNADSLLDVMRAIVTGGITSDDI